MLLHAPNESRPYHLGPLPQEVLPRDAGVLEVEASRPRSSVRAAAEIANAPFAVAVGRYHRLFASLATGNVAAAKAPVPDDPARRAVDIKGGGYFLNASGVGICGLPPNAWFLGCDVTSDTHAVVVMVEHGRVPEADNMAAGWVSDGDEAAGDLRAAEIATCLAGHIRQMGFAAQAHSVGHSQVDIERLAVMAGLVVRNGEVVLNPYLGTRFSLAAVTTEYALEPDMPLAADTPTSHGLRYWLGINGAQSGREAGTPQRAGQSFERLPDGAGEAGRASDDCDP